MVGVIVVNIKNGMNGIRFLGTRPSQSHKSVERERHDKALTVRETSTTRYPIPALPLLFVLRARRPRSQSLSQKRISLLAGGAEDGLPEVTLGIHFLSFQCGQSNRDMRAVLVPETDDHVGLARHSRMNRRLP